jgi:hypothetical protein
MRLLSKSWRRDDETSMVTLLFCFTRKRKPPASRSHELLFLPKMRKNLLCLTWILARLQLVRVHSTIPRDSVRESSVEWRTASNSPTSHRAHANVRGRPIQCMHCVHQHRTGTRNARRRNRRY